MQPMDVGTVKMFSYVLFLLLLKFVLSDADCRTILFLQQQHNKTLVNHVIWNGTVGNEEFCRAKCYMSQDCVSYNCGPSSMGGMTLCQLNDADRYQYPLDFKEKPGFTYEGTVNKCQNTSCPNNNTRCQNGFGPYGYRCVCTTGFEGPNCATEIFHKIKVNTNPVCIGTKNDSFGVFYTPLNAYVKSFQMVHISGGVAWGGELKWRGRWGDLLDNHIELHITNSKNQRLAPPENYQLAVPTYLRYDLPGQSNNGTNITLPEFKPRLRVSKNEEFRIWYGQDLVKKEEDNSHGTTCKDVFMEYREV